MSYFTNWNELYTFSVLLFLGQFTTNLCPFMGCWRSLQCGFALWLWLGTRAGSSRVTVNKVTILDTMSICLIIHNLRCNYLVFFGICEVCKYSYPYIHLCKKNSTCSWRHIFSDHFSSLLSLLNGFIPGLLQ